MEALDSSLEQLAVYIHPQKQILSKDVENLLGKSVQEDVFQLMECLLEKDVSRSCRILESLIKEGSGAHEILPVLASQFERLYRAVVLLDENKSAQEVGVELKMHPYFLDKFIRQARKVSLSEIRKILKQLLECDHGIKTGRFSPTPALEKAVLEIGLGT